MRTPLLLVSTVLLAACVTPYSTPTPAADSYTNMPAQCVGISTDLTNKPLSSCPSSNQKFSRAAPESWVRVCQQTDNDAGTVQSCTFQTMVWQRWSTVKNGSDRIEVCTALKVAGDPAAGTGASCPAAGSTTGFGGMKQIAPYDGVAEVPPLPQQALTVTPASGAAPLNVTVAWNVPGMPSGTPCQAQSVGLTSNAPGPWSGPKSAVGSDAISSLVESTRFTLNCVYSKDIAVVVSWQPPTLNTDGTPATDINGFTVVYGQSPQELSQSANAAANVGSLLVQDFYFKADQTWYFAVRANNSGGNQSDLSNLAQVKLVKPGDVTAPFAGSVTATVTGKVPFPPTDATAEQVDAPADTGQVDKPPVVKQRVIQRVKQEAKDAVKKTPEERRRER